MARTRERLLPKKSHAVLTSHDDTDGSITKGDAHSTVSLECQADSERLRFITRSNKCTSNYDNLPQQQENNVSVFSDAQIKLFSLRQ